MAIYPKLANIDNRQYGVFDLKYFGQHSSILKDDDHCAVEVEKNGKNYILPIMTNYSNMDKPGIYTSSDGKISIITYPEENNESVYMPENDNVICFSDHKSLQSISDAKRKLDENINRLLEVDGGDVYKPPLLETDSAEMRAMKECIIAKNIDLDKYKDRFGANYPNDKRKLKDDNITLNMISRMCENLDIKLDLVFTDVNSNVPNAMNKVIRANIIPGDGTCTIQDISIDEEETE